MSGGPKKGDGCIGQELDRICWDYDDPKREPRFFLNPMSTFFGDFPWEGRRQGVSKAAAFEPMSPRGAEDSG